MSEPKIVSRSLRELGAQLMKHSMTDTWAYVDSVSEADGVMFQCPACFEANGGPVGTHSIVCWAPSVPLTFSPGPGRWNLRGSSIDDLELVAGSSSVKLTGGCEAHFHVRGGRVVP